jgi:hypothetical protein
LGKSRNRSHSEVEHLRGLVKQLRAELKYYKRRSHLHEEIIDEVIEDQDVTNIDVSLCSNCGKGALIEYDFHYINLKKCDHCGYQEKQKNQRK